MERFEMLKCFGRVTHTVGVAASIWLLTSGFATGEELQLLGEYKRTVIIDPQAILARWQPIAQAAGMATPHWREQFALQLRSLPDYLVERIAAVSADANDPRTSYRRFTQAFVNAYANLVQNARPEDKTRLKLGSQTTDQVFIPIPPCRIVDTRNIGGPISATFARNFYYYSGTGTFSWSSQGGAAGDGALRARGPSPPLEAARWAMWRRLQRLPLLQS